METLLKFLGNLTLTFIVLICGMLMGLFGTYVALDIAKLFELSFIVALGLEKLYGVALVVGLLRMKSSSNDSKGESYSDQMLSGLGKAFEICIAILISWPLFYFAHWLFFH